MELWEKAFATKFKVTKGYESFLATLEHIAIANGYAARVLPIIQSSGAGKSRMLDEAAKTIFTFPICLREDNEMGKELCAHSDYDSGD